MTAFTWGDIDSWGDPLTWGSLPASVVTLPDFSLTWVQTQGTNRSDVAQQAVETEAGLLADNISGATSDLIWLTSEAKINQAIWLTADINAGQVDTFPPVYDTQRLENDVTASTPLGDARVLDTASIDVNGPFAGSLAVGGSLDDAHHRAAWEVGAHKDLNVRLPSLVLDLENDSGMMTTWQSGDPLWRRLRVSNPPGQITGPVDVFIEGYTEFIRYGINTVTVNCSPADPWLRCFTIADTTTGRLDMDATTVTTVGCLSGTGTGTFTTTTSNGPLATTAVGDFPFDINLEGERVTISGISSSTNPQTWTVSVRGVSTTARAHATATPVHLWTQPVISLGALN